MANFRFLFKILNQCEKYMNTLNPEVFFFIFKFNILMLIIPNK